MDQKPDGTFFKENQTAGGRDFFVELAYHLPIPDGFK